MFFVKELNAVNNSTDLLNLIVILQTPNTQPCNIQTVLQS